MGEDSTSENPAVDHSPSRGKDVSNWFLHRGLVHNIGDSFCEVPGIGTPKVGTLEFVRVITKLVCM